MAELFFALQRLVWALPIPDFRVAVPVMIPVCGAIAGGWWLWERRQG